LNVRKDKFFSIISHDLREPFNTLLGFVQLLSKNIKRYSLDEIKYNVDRIQTTGESLYALLENLLTWSRIQRGAIQYEPEVIDLFELAEENMTIFMPKANHKEIILNNSIQDNTLVYADNSMVNTILRNLVSNALKFTEARGNISVSAVPREQYVEIAVSDTGQGIDSDGLSQLFRIDTQYTHVGTAGELGTGLGLSLCKELVEKNGGQIWVNSVIGKGATFLFTLPRASKERRNHGSRKDSYC
jgi:signal transduction histidine kinase